MVARVKRRNTEAELLEIDLMTELGGDALGGALCTPFASPAASRKRRLSLEE